MRSIRDVLQSLTHYSWEKIVLSEAWQNLICIEKFIHTQDASAERNLFIEEARDHGINETELPDILQQSDIHIGSIWSSCWKAMNKEILFKIIPQCDAKLLLLKKNANFLREYYKDSIYAEDFEILIQTIDEKLKKLVKLQFIENELKIISEDFAELKKGTTNIPELTKSTKDKMFQNKIAHIYQGFVSSHGKIFNDDKKTISNDDKISLINALALEMARLGKELEKAYQTQLSCQSKIVELIFKLDGLNQGLTDFQLQEAHIKILERYKVSSLYNHNKIKVLLKAKNIIDDYDDLKQVTLQMIHLLHSALNKIEMKGVLKNYDITPTELTFCRKIMMTAEKIPNKSLQLKAQYHDIKTIKNIMEDVYRLAEKKDVNIKKWLQFYMHRASEVHESFVWLYHMNSYQKFIKLLYHANSLIKIPEKPRFLQQLKYEKLSYLFEGKPQLPSPQNNVMIGLTRRL